MMFLNGRKFFVALVVSLSLLLSNGGKAMAQTPVSVSPEVKADVLQRLESARTFQVTEQMFPYISDKYSRKYLRDSIRICNNGPGPKDSETQLQACGPLENTLHHDPETPDQLMVFYKTCVLVKTGCETIVRKLIETSQFSSAFAFVQFAPECDAYCKGRLMAFIDAKELTTSGLVVTYHDGSVLLSWESRVPDATLLLTNPVDVKYVLEGKCRGLGEKPSCEMFEQMGGTYNEADRVQQEKQTAAIDAEAEAFNKKMDEEDARRAQEAPPTPSTNNSGGGFLSNLAAALTQVQQEQGMTIEQANARNQANMAATAAAIQQRQQQQQQTQRQQPTNVYAPPAPPRQTTTTTTASAAAPAWSVSGPTVQPTCTVMNNYVEGNVRVNADGWVSATLTNTSTQPLYVSWSFKKNGVPASNMADTGGGTINPGQTVGGEGGGIWSTDADKNSPEIYWYAVLKSDSDAGKPCTTKRW